MANAGLDIQSLQYLMGHSDIGVTLNTYTHSSYDVAEKVMAKIPHSESSTFVEAAAN